MDSEPILHQKRGKLNPPIKFTLVRSWRPREIVDARTSVRIFKRDLAAARALCYNLDVDADGLPRWAVPEVDRRWMREALVEAERALAHGDVPVGAIAVREGQIVGRGHNRREVDRDPTAHAEMIALREAARALGGWRLRGVTLYCTLEPCPMCAGAMVQAQIDRLVYGADDPKAGAAGSVVELLREPRFNHRVAVTRGVLVKEAEALLRRFFAGLRARQKT